jgi:thiamine-monophosphate kinase
VSHVALVSDTGERALIERIRLRIPPAPPDVLVGIGDDAAVTVPERGTLQVITTDALVEGVHFDRRFSSAADIGYKALAVNVSDVAAMGGVARLALLSLMLPAGIAASDVDGLVDGLLEVAGSARVTLVGGNVTRSPGPLVVDVTVVGSVRRRRILTRSGGHPGDGLYVTGSVGAAAAGLEWLRREATDPASAPSEGTLAECVARHRRPEPRARIGALLGRNRAASACMDASDGLADAVSQMAAASGAGAKIDAEALPIHPGARRWFESEGRDPVRSSVGGSDDYELVFTVPRKIRSRLRSVLREARGVSITRIGELTADGAVSLVRNGCVEPLPSGFVHF